MSRGRASSIIGIVFGLLFVALGIFAVVFVLRSGSPEPEPDGGQEPTPDEQPAPDVADDGTRTFGDYSWDELSEIALLMEAAPDEAAARAIAQEHGLIDESGHLTTEVHPLILDNGIVAEVRLVGILHDTKADGGGRVALTFMTSPIDFRRINSTPTSEGGWKGSEIRAWLRSDAIDLLPDDLASHIVSVTKQANNVGKTSDAADITATYDPLWLFSCREVCGEITWLYDEFDYLAEDNDAILNAEGRQYEAFIQAGIDQHTGSSPYLVMRYQDREVAWWFRTPYAFEYMVDTDDAFYQVTATGFVGAVNLADTQAGIVMGFCM